MMRPLGLISLAWCLFLRLAESAAPCEAVGPLSLPIRNVSLEGDLPRRGVSLSLGTPPQDLAFQMSFESNNTFVYDGSSCPSAFSNKPCLVQRGGLFRDGTSTTFSRADNMNASGASPESNEDLSSVVWASETIRLNATHSQDEVPVGVAPNRRVPNSEWDMNALGLGSNSTLLNTLVSAGKIPSRTVGLFYGLAGGESKHQMDGTVMLGGYDAAKITGENFTDTLSSAGGCATSMMLTMSDILLNFPNGTDLSILGTSRGKAYRACIVPNYPLITIPYDIYQSFEALTNTSSTNRSVGVNFWGMNFGSNNVYDGDLTFVLSSGLPIRIPSHQLVRPDISINSEGKTVIANSSEAELMLNSLQDINENDLPMLGQPFLSAIYLLVSYETNRYTVWQSKPTTDQQLLAVSRDSQAVCSAASTPTSAPPTAPPNTSPEPDPDLNRNRQKGVGGGTIAGITIGAVSGVALGVSGFIWWYRRRKQSSQVNLSWPAPDVEPSAMPLAPSTVQELYAGQIDPAEMPVHNGLKAR